MTFSEEYRQNGGFCGFAHADLEKANSDPTHELHEAILAIQAGDSEKAASLLMDAFKRGEIEGNRESPALLLLKIRLIQKLVKFAEDNVDKPALLEGLPVRIIQWAAMGVSLKEVKADAGRKKGKKWKEKVIAAYEDLENKNRSATACAMTIFKKLGGSEESYDENGKKIMPIPSERTIAGIIREHKQNLPDSSMR